MVSSRVWGYQLQIFKLITSRNRTGDVVQTCASRKMMKNGSAQRLGFPFFFFQIFQKRAPLSQTQGIVTFLERWESLTSFRNPPGPSKSSSLNAWEFKEEPVGSSKGMKGGSHSILGVPCSFCSELLLFRKWRAATREQLRFLQRTMVEHGEANPTWSLHEPLKEMGSITKIKGSWTHVYFGSWRQVETDLPGR